jgi:hypothetical protein
MKATTNTNHNAIYKEEKKEEDETHHPYLRFELVICVFVCQVLG